MTDQGRQELHETFSRYGAGHITFHDHDDNTADDASSNNGVRSLIKPFVIKQWLHRGKLDVAAEHAGGPGLAQFILTFFPTWGLWSEFRSFVNASGTDDILQRAGILYMMALLIGYTANASAISIAYPVESAGEAATTEGVTEAVSHVLAAVLGESGTTMKSGRDMAIVAATVFYLLGRALRIAFLLMYAVTLPRFRTALLFASLHQIIGWLIYFPLLFVRSKTAVIVLASLGMAWDILARYLIGLNKVLGKQRKLADAEKGAAMYQQNADPSTLTQEDTGPNVVVQTCHNAFDKERGDSMKGSVPALNIEHFLERTAAFVVIVLGEMVLSVVYHANASQIGFNKVYGNAICGLIIAFNYCWLYFDAECSRRFLHAIRRHWFSGLTFTTLHFPLCASLILVSAALSRMTLNQDEISDALRWYFCGGLGTAMICLGALGMTHRGLDPNGTTRLGRRVQLGMRTAVGIIMICLPLADHHTLTPLKLAGICAALSSFLVIEETYGKLCRGEPISKPSASEEAAQKNQNEEFMEDEKLDEAKTKTD
ncbi:SubName: Full=Uncharacterized protein {ECO:0000313/EMBL:CCA71182.1} [Serendipita indica DSM 11827]|nr:SubName: Full=Uncharacterized protein {ECO:0000313/EMBL:CCA71182.1} [Serendipita indica DSM 11827]